MTRNNSRHLYWLLVMKLFSLLGVFTLFRPSYCSPAVQTLAVQTPYSSGVRSDCQLQIWNLRSHSVTVSQWPISIGLFANSASRLKVFPKISNSSCKCLRTKSKNAIVAIFKLKLSTFHHETFMNGNRTALDAWQTSGKLRRSSSQVSSWNLTSSRLLTRSLLVS